VDVVRAEVSALAHIVGFRRRGKGGNAHRICLRPVVEDPDELEAILLVIEHGFVEHDEEIARRQRQAIVGAAAERRRPVAVGDHRAQPGRNDIAPTACKIGICRTTEHSIAPRRMCARVRAAGAYRLHVDLSKLFRLLPTVRSDD
jgi:hypothetical protein